MEKSKNFEKNKLLIISLSIISLFLLLVVLFLSYNYFLRNSLGELNNALNKTSKSISDCKVIYDFEKKGNKNNKYLNKELLKNGISFCEKNYNFDRSIFYDDFSYCREIIANENSYFSENFLHIDENNLHLEREKCYTKNVSSIFSIASNGTVFDSFKTNLKLNFNTDIARNIDNLTEEQKNYIKEIILNKIKIEPKVELLKEDLFLSQSSANLLIDTNGKTKYKISFLDKNAFEFKTPEKKYFGVQIKNPLSLYHKNNLPDFQILSYNSGKTKTKVNICELTPQQYSKIEVFENTGDKNSKHKFLIKNLKSSNYKNCYTKELKISNEKNKLNKVEFTLNDFIKEKNGLYTVFLDYSENVSFDNKINNPLFFGVVNSHIMMKISKNGQGFFFVNDFEGKPLKNQKISAYINDFKEFNNSYNRSSSKREISYNLDENIKVFGEEIFLGETDENGVLKLDVSKKIKGAFEKTFGDGYEYNYNGIYNSFFVKSKGSSNLGFLTSTWNAGIEPWNFGYTTWYINNKSNYSNEFQLNSWSDKKDFNSHIFTDRVLYLPEEKVYIKGVVRNSKNLSIPKADKKFILKVRKPDGKELLNTEVSLNSFGSFSKTLNLTKEAKLGNYDISFLDNNGNYLANSGFSVEVFKKPKFKNEVSVETTGLNEQIVNITKEEKENNWYYGTKYLGDFSIKGFVKSKYYSGNDLKNVDFTYKVFKQPYYADDYWDDCYYGCYWTPRKNFYTEGKGKIGPDGIGNFEIPIKFESSYGDYKYIVEVTVTDDAGDTITGSNSVVAKLPETYKKYNYNSNFYLEPNSRFVKVGQKLKITGGLNIGKWKKDYHNRFGLIIKRKNYTNQKVIDVNGYKRNIVSFEEQIEKVIPVNDKNFKLNKDGKIEYNFTPKQDGEYIFEYGKIQTYMIGKYFSKQEKNINSEDIEELFARFDKEKSMSINFVEKRKNCKKTNEFSGECEKFIVKNNYLKLYLRDLVSGSYFPVVAYGGKKSTNPIQNDNKINVISEKVSYKVGETAKILVRLPVSDAKILLTIEKDGVEKYEYIDVKGNTFFKEIEVNNSLSPNTYVSVFMIDTENKILPEYKVGYTEIVIDKTDKKSFIDIKTDSEEYAPRGEVNLDFTVKDKSGKPVESELTVMVVDDSLISLMGNINPNILEKIFVKFPFSVQTSMSNIAMIKNYYFSRRGIVGGSGFGDFKGGDSAVSTRNVFKNTAFYKADIITDKTGKAKTKFTLPDNLTNFRIMVISNSKDNHFGYEEKFIKVRKPVILEDKTPLILRVGDKTQIGALLFNNTGKDMGFKTTLKIDGIHIKNKEKNVKIKSLESQFITWDLQIKDTDVEKITYTISALGDSSKNSDKLENNIEIKKTPILLNIVFESFNILGGEIKKGFLKTPENTDYKSSKVEIVVSNNRVIGIENIASSLAKYPYGCIEQLTSSTLPNVLLKNLTDLFPDIYSKKELDKNISAGLEKIIAHQNEDGGFNYWDSGDSNLQVTPYVLRTLIYMKNRGENINQNIINKAVSYLEKNYEKASNDDKGEIYFALKMAGKEPKINFDYTKFNTHSLLSFTYGLVLSKNQNTELIETNIEIIKNKLEKQKKSYYYWSPLGDKAIFTKLLLDYNYEKYNFLVDSYIEELYKHNWSSYYYSTQTKNNAFMAFYKYLKLKKNNSNSNGLIKIGGKIYDINISKDNLVHTIQVPLSELISEKQKNLDFELKNQSKHNLYFDIKLESYPLDIEKVKTYSNGVKIEENIYEVLDEKRLEKCVKNYNHYDEEKIDCSKVLKKVVGNTYKKGKLYKSEINIIFPEGKARNYVTLEDYLPGTFRVINSKFKTESSSVRRGNKNWNWDYSEFRPNVVMANSSYWWGENNSFEFYFKPEFVGSFVNPPATVYEMYNPKIRAYNEYKVIKVEE